MSRSTLLLPALIITLLPVAKAQVIPLDPQVRTGKLANGFTYYIRKNPEPQHQVQLYLVNKVGSVLEDDDQQGLAHFMEHMNFNGTKHFPKNQLVDYLQKAGVQFGTDLNAYTNTDETVYQLPIPTDKPGMLSNGLRIMRDWAQEALLDSVEINNERGVVLEEERLGKGAHDRMSRSYFPMILNHSRYADRLPIGMNIVLRTFRPEAIRRFYNDWYRPDLQALIIVGDLDVNEVESKVRKEFSSLVNPKSERKRPSYNVELTGHNQFMSVTDPEFGSMEIQVLFKHRAPTLETEQDYLALMKRSLFNELLESRCQLEITKEKEPAFVSMNAGIQSLMGGMDMFSFDVIPKNGRSEAAFKQAWNFIERVRRYGFSQNELDMGKKRYQRSLQTLLSEKDKTNSVSYVKEYQNLFLNKEASPGIAWEASFVERHLSSINLDDLKAIAKDYIGERNLDILVLAPQKQVNDLPDSAMVTGWMESSAVSNLNDIASQQTVQPLISIYPQPGKVVAKEFVSRLNLTKITLNNGVHVILKPTSFKNDEIRVAAFSPGGTSLYEGADYDNATNASAIINRAGVAGFDPSRLSVLLNGKVINVSTGLSARNETVSGSFSPTDLETALQLLYLQFTSPRKDSILFKNVVNNSRELLANRYTDPKKVFADTINNVLGNYNYRTAPPSISRLNSISLDRIYSIYKERFADASGFTFVFTGNIKVETMVPLLEQYLGALPALHRNEKPIDHGVHIPEGHIEKTVYKGMENQATVRMVFSGAHEYSSINNLKLKALGEILQIKLIENIREKEGEVYSPSVQTNYQKLPHDQYSIMISFGCAPQNTEHLKSLVLQEATNLVSKGPELNDVEKFKAAYAKTMELALADNGFWTGYLIGQLENNEDLFQILNYKDELNSINADNLKSAARQFIDPKNLIQFVLLPEDALKAKDI